MPEQTIEAVRQVEGAEVGGKKPKVAAARSLLVDVVRGLAISLVVLGHTDEGTEHRYWWGSSPVGVRLENFIYSFHMPAFFFVSGIFIASSVAKRGPSRFISTKVSQLIYPYFLWSVLQYFLTIPLERFMHIRHYTPREFLLQLLNGETLWFLPAVFFCVLLGMLLRNVSKPLLFAAATALSLLPVHWHVHFVETTVQFFPFLVAGMWLARDYERIEKISIAVAAAGIVLMGALVYVIATGSLYRKPWTVTVVGLAGTAMLFLLARCCQKGSFARAMAWVGEASFGVYLMSAYGQGIGREFLLRVLHTTEPYLQLALPTLLGISIPAWIYQHRVRLKLDWLFLWPFSAKEPEKAKP